MTQVEFIRQSKGSSVNECCVEDDGEITQNWAQCAACLLTKDYSMMITGLIYAIVWVLVICGYFAWRYKVDIRRFKLRPSKMVMYVFCITMVGVAAMVAIQYQTGHWIYSLSNFETISVDMKPKTVNTETLNVTLISDKAIPTQAKSDRYISYSRIFQLFVGSPIVEELLFRVILFFTIYKRINKPITSMVAANLVFSGLHLVNILMKSGNAYTFFQMVAGFLLGMFYSTRYFLTLNFAENILLHMINNLSAIFIPVQITFEDVYPDFIVPIVLSLLTYTILLIRDIRTIRRKYK
ncbi:leuS2 [Acrasis kona]|uniref:LeuS2 n=1 Tax=Acrasis kona TaxID=1008807 RepID=A0AAW2YTK5_9EUKA